MSNYKIANQIKLRFNTSRGVLAVEHLWDLPLVELDELTVELEKLCEESNTKSFLTKKSDEDKIAKLRFDISYDILTSRVEAMEISKNEKEDKEYNQKILGLIASKQDDDLSKLSVEELKTKLKK